MPYKDPERKKEYMKKYCQIHKEEIRLKARKYRLEHKEIMNRRSRKHYREFKKKLMEKLGGKCVYCGCTNIQALEINHINGGGHLENKRKGCYRIFREILDGIYPYPIELTCKVCNAVHYLKLKGIDGFKVIWKDGLVDSRPKLSSIEKALNLTILF